MNKYSVPRIAFVNKMDRAGANFLRCVEQIRTRLRGNPVPIQLPIGAEDNFEGVVDLITHEGDLVGRRDPGHDASSIATFPPTCRRSATECRAKMIEAAAEGNEELLNKYLEGGRTRPRRRSSAGLRERAIRNEICLTLCGSAFKNKGVQAMLDAVIEYMPSPTEMPPVKGLDDGRQPRRRARRRDDAPFSALAFKILNDPFVGNLTFFRVYSGVLNSGDQVFVPGKEQEGAHRPPAADACERARGNQGSPRRRHRRGRGSQGRHDRRHAVRPGRTSSRSRRWSFPSR